jgi:hypothetical protein
MGKTIKTKNLLTYKQFGILKKNVVKTKRTETGGDINETPVDINSEVNS